MSALSAFDDAMKRAVMPGPDRLLVGVAVAAAKFNRSDSTNEMQEYSAAYGTTQLDPTSPPVSTKTVMWIASCTKLVTTVAALQCLERGLFSLDNPDDVDRLLPEWKDPEILTDFDEQGQAILQPAKEKITLRKLLTHTSGVSYDFLDPILIKWRQSRGEPWLTMKAPLTQCFAAPLLFEPGSSWQYGGGIDLAGLMVARANHCTLEEYMRKNIFDVLGMSDTSMYAGYNDIGKRLMPISTRITPDAPITDGTPPEAPVSDLVNPADEFGGSGLCSTVEDYMRFLKSLLRDDGQLLKPESNRLLFQPSIGPASRAKLNEMMAMRVKGDILANGEPQTVPSSAEVWSHSLAGRLGLEESEEGLKVGWLGWGGAPNLKWWIDREGGTCGFFATQLYPPFETKHVFLNNMFQRAMAARFSTRGDRVF